MKKIDIHLHVVYDGQDQFKEPYYFNDAQTMKKYMDKNDIMHGIILSSEEYINDNYSSNIDLSSIAHKYPETFSWMCNLDLSKTDDLEKRLTHYKNLGAKGLGEFTGGLNSNSSLRFDDPKLNKVFCLCEKLELPFLFHMSPKANFNYGVVDDPGLPYLEQALKKHKNLKFIGHSQPFWYEIGGDMPADFESRNNYPEGKVKKGGRLPELFRKHPNLFGDLSANSGSNAIIRDPEFGYDFLEEFQDRLMFGTDMVNTNMSFPLEDFLDKAVAEKKISEKTYKKICRDNAVRILDLEV